MEIILVLIILVVAVVLFATETFPIDMVALMVLAALVVLQLVTPEQAVSGLNNPATVTVACMFVLSAGLQRTGAVKVVGRAIVRFGKNPMLLLVLTMVVVGVASAFINNTGVVAVMLPMVLAAAAKNKLSPSKLLIPMSFASQAGGVCTLIGTSTNLLVSAIAQKSPYVGEPFSMFELGQLGVILFGVCIVYFVLFGRWLLPERPAQELTKSYELGEYITELRVMKDSPLIDKTLRASKLSKDHDVKILKLIRRGKPLVRPTTRRLKAADILLIEGKVKDLINLKDAEKLELAPEHKFQDKDLKAEDLSLVQVVVPPNSHLIGRTLTDVYFHRRHRAIVLAVQRRGHRLREKIDDIRLAAADALLVQGPTEEIDRLRKDENFIILEEIEEGLLRKTKAPLAVMVITGVVLLATLNVMPIVASALVGAVLMVLVGCLNLEDAYEAIDWKVIFLLAGILPLGLAMQNSGAAALVAGWTVNLTGQWGPVAVLSAIYVLTVLLTSAMSNNATAVLLAPIAISTALDLGVNPKPFLIAVTFGASTCFATPIGYQTNAMIYNPGGYKYTDFLKVGIPLNLIFWGLATFFIPRIWPL
jgi:di/tricarboxylate transporter